MFSDKNYGLPKELIEAAKRVHEKQLEENLVTEEEIAEAFAIFLEENFHVEMLTEEDLDYVFEEEFPVWFEEVVGRQSRQNSTRGNDLMGSLLSRYTAGERRKITSSFDAEGPSSRARAPAVGRNIASSFDAEGPSSRARAPAVGRNIASSFDAEGPSSRARAPAVGRNIASSFDAEGPSSRARAPAVGRNITSSFDAEGPSSRARAPAPRNPEGGGSQRIGARARAPAVGRNITSSFDAEGPSSRAPAPPPRNPEGGGSQRIGARAPAVGVNPGNAMTGGLGDGNSVSSAARNSQPPTPRREVKGPVSAQTPTARKQVRRPAPKIDYKTPVTRRGPDGTYGLTSKGRRYVARKAAQERNDWRAAAFAPKD